MMREKFIEAINAKNNDVKTFVWKLAKNNDGVQEEIKLMDATPEQLKQFYKHCDQMLNNTNKTYPGRNVLLKLIKEQRNKCNVELFLRSLESGAICSDKKGYPRYLYLQDLGSFINDHKEEFPNSELKHISIASCIPGCVESLPREYERISIEDVQNACLDKLGFLQMKHISFKFILSLGIYLTPDELKMFPDRNEKTRMTTIKEKLGINTNVELLTKASGLNFKEFQAMITLMPKKYSDLTTEQLTILRNKVLFRLENKISKHVAQWEERMRQIELVAKTREISLD